VHATRRRRASWSAAWPVLGLAAAVMAGCGRGPRAAAMRPAVTITTRPERLAVGETYCFHARVATPAGASRAVTWSAAHGASRGRLFPDGCYEATAPGGDAVTATSRQDATAEETVSFRIVPAAAETLGVLRDLVLPTYAGAQVVHPSELAACPADGRWRYRTAATPYPYLDSRYENPSVFVSSDGIHWVLQPGTPNPLVVPGVAGQSPVPAVGAYHSGISAGRYATLSDPDLVCDPEAGTLRLYFRQIGERGEFVLLTESAGDSVWTPPRVVMTGRAATGHELVSPSFVRWGRGWQAWFVDGVCGEPASTVRTRRSADGRTWVEAPRAVAIAQPGYVVWHLQVRAFRGALWMLYSAYPADARHCFAGDLFLARSDDGSRWTTFAEPVLDHRAWPAFGTGLYRSSMLYDSLRDVLTLQVSGFHRSHDTLAAGLGTIRLSFGALLQRLAAPAAPAAAREAARP
jgi:hypothetical protein